MNTDKSKSGFLICVCLCLSVALLCLTGCSTPSKANIDLRKQIDDLQSQTKQLELQHQADLATIAGLKGATTVPSLPEDRVAQLFTTHGLKFGRLTGPGDLDPSTPGDDGLKVYVCPTDEQGQPLKASGSFQIDAFDLAKSGETRVGHWTFDVDQARQSWYGAAMLYTYVLKCPLSSIQNARLTLHVKFTDALTGRVFTVQREVQIGKAQVTRS